MFFSVLFYANNKLGHLEADAVETKQFNPQLCRTGLVLCSPGGQRFSWRVVNVFVSLIQEVVYARQHRLCLLLQEVDQQDGERVRGEGALGLAVQPDQVSPVPETDAQGTDSGNDENGDIVNSDDNLSDR